MVNKSHNLELTNYLAMELPKYEVSKLRVADKDFYVPNFSEHYLLFKYNYNVSQLKNICRKYKLPRSGSKSKLFVQIYNYLYYSYYATKIQKHIRGYLQRKVNRMRGPAYLKRKLCVNDCDFFTLEPLSDIKKNQFFSLKDSDGFIYGFDIVSLWQLFQKSKTAENPYNRQILPEETRKTLQQLIKMSKKNKTNINTKLKNNEIDMEKQLELRIVDLFHFINTLGHYTDHSWFLSLDKQNIIYFYRELYDIWNHRAQISSQTKYNISPRGNPFRIANLRDISLNNSLYDLRKICVTTCENLTYYGMTNDDKTLGAYYILSALTLQSVDAAAALPWLYQSVV